MAHFIIRHAATPLNHPDERQSRIRAGTDPPTSPEGRVHIQRIAQFFKGQPIHGVHSSDTRRAGDTGAAIAAVTGAVHHVQPAFGPWNLGSLKNHKVQDVEHILRHLFQHPQEHAPDGGESFEEFFNRYLPALKGVLQEQGRNHVIVTHGRNVKTLWSLLRGQGHLLPGFDPHDPRPTAPGDVYHVTPQDLHLVLRQPQGSTAQGRAGS